MFKYSVSKHILCSLERDKSIPVFFKNDILCAISPHKCHSSFWSITIKFGRRAQATEGLRNTGTEVGNKEGKNGQGNSWFGERSYYLRADFRDAARFSLLLLIRLRAKLERPRIDEAVRKVSRKYQMQPRDYSDRDRIWRRRQTFN